MRLAPDFQSGGQEMGMEEADRYGFFHGEAVYSPPGRGEGWVLKPEAVLSFFYPPLPLPGGELAVFDGTDFTNSYLSGWRGLGCSAFPPINRWATFIRP
jgi:hypothetical protein